MIMSECTRVGAKFFLSVLHKSIGLSWRQVRGGGWGFRHPQLSPVASPTASMDEACVPRPPAACMHAVRLSSHCDRYRLGRLSCPRVRLSVCRTPAVLCGEDVAVAGSAGLAGRPGTDDDTDLISSGCLPPTTNTSSRRRHTAGRRY